MVDTSTVVIAFFVIIIVLPGSLFVMLALGTDARRDRTPTPIEDRDDKTRVIPPGTPFTLSEEQRTLLVAAQLNAWAAADAPPPQPHTGNGTAPGLPRRRP